MPLPTYPGLRIALPNRREIARRIEEAAPDALHIATEGPIGWAVRAYCRRRKLAFTTSYTTRFPEYVAVRTGLPAQRRLCGDAALSCRIFHSHGRNRFAAAGTRRAGLSQTRLLDARRRHRTVQPAQPCDARSAAADLHDHGPRRGGKESRGVSVARFAGIESGHRRRTAEGAAREAISRRDFPRREEGRGPDRASRRCRRLRVSEPHRYVRRRAARGTGLRHAGCGVSGHRPEGCHRRSSDRRDRHRSAQRVPARADDVARGLPEFCAVALLGKQRAAVHRQSDGAAAEPRVAAGAPGARHKRRAGLVRKRP